MALSEYDYQRLLENRAKAGGVTAPKAKAKAQKPSAKIIKQDDRQPNWTEKRYISEIVCVTEGVESWDYEAISLKLGNGVRYTPDWLVIFANGRMELHEVKGGGPIQDDAIVKLKVAAARYRGFRFVLARYIDQRWFIQEVLP